MASTTALRLSAREVAEDLLHLPWERGERRVEAIQDLIEGAQRPRGFNKTLVVGSGVLPGAPVHPEALETPIWSEIDVDMDLVVVPGEGKPELTPRARGGWKQRAARSRLQVRPRASDSGYWRGPGAA